MKPEITTATFHEEAFDTKLLRQRNVLKARCPKCHNWGDHHRPQCEDATVADALHHMEEARKFEKHAKDRAAEWMQACRQMHGKIALLKHENNQLRKKAVLQPDRPTVKKLHWIEGPARGGTGTAGKRNGIDYWWDGDLLLVVVDTNGGPETFLVRVYADGDQLAMHDPYTQDDNFGYSPSDVSWYAKVDKALPGEEEPQLPASKPTAGDLWCALPCEDKEVFLVRHGFKTGWSSHTWHTLDRPIQAAWEGRCP